MHTGVDQVTATPADSSFETAVAKIQVASAGDVKLVVTSGDKQASSPGAALPQPIVIHITDINNLPYPGAPIQALPSTGGSVTPAIAVADATGAASFQWTPGASQAPTLQLFIQGTPPASGLQVTALPSHPGHLNGVSNALTGVAGLAPGMLASAYGENLAGGAEASAPFAWPFLLSGVSVAVNGEPARVLFVRDDQVNFLVPGDLAAGTASVTVTSKAGPSAPFTAIAADVSPAIFVLDNGYGAILRAGTALANDGRYASPPGRVHRDLLRGIRCSGSVCDSRTLSDYGYAARIHRGPGTAGDVQRPRPGLSDGRVPDRCAAPRLHAYGYKALMI